MNEIGGTDPSLPEEDFPEAFAGPVGDGEDDPSLVDVNLLSMLPADHWKIPVVLEMERA